MVMSDKDTSQASEAETSTVDTIENRIKAAVFGFTTAQATPVFELDEDEVTKRANAYGRFVCAEVRRKQKIAKVLVEELPGILEQMGKR